LFESIININTIYNFIFLTTEFDSNALRALCYIYL